MRSIGSTSRRTPRRDPAFGDLIYCYSVGPGSNGFRIPTLRDYSPATASRGKGHALQTAAVGASAFSQFAVWPVGTSVFAAVGSGADGFCGLRSACPVTFYRDIAPALLLTRI